MDPKSFAIDIATQAGDIMRNNFTIGMAKQWKADETPVTATDKAINKLVIDSVTKNFPGYAVIGEEESLDSDAEYKWICDPVDGTVPFSYGYPTFVFALSLTQNGEVILGVLYDVMMDRMAVAEKGKGAFLNNKQIFVSKNANFMHAMVNTDVEYPLAHIRELLNKKGAWTPNLFSAQYAGLLVAMGEFVGEIFEFKYPWDGAAVKIIVEEAGGKVTDLNGNDQRYDQPINGYIASNGLLHDELVKLVNEIKNES
ncbi:MAG TPA: inositol monophosphatase family protein [Candidatus Nitrosocosmicus sp.]|nr:inositol monophosphatase family protein [Candidatus Nitrosocosmicus sp.]